MECKCNKFSILFLTLINCGMLLSLIIEVVHSGISLYGCYVAFTLSSPSHRGCGLSFSDVTLTLSSRLARPSFIGDLITLILLSGILKLYSLFHVNGLTRIIILAFTIYSLLIRFILNNVVIR